VTTTRAAQLTLDDALARKAAGLDRVEATHPDFVPRLRAAVKAHAQRYGTVTADDVRRLADQLGLRPRHPNAWGAVFRGPGWIRVGERVSETPSNHGHRNPVWAWREPA
jgi:hypothetical protein